MGGADAPPTLPSLAGRQETIGNMSTHIVILAAVSLLFAYAAYTDLTARIIPNRVCAAVFAVAVLRIALGEPADAVWDVAAAGAVTIALIVGFAFRMVGGGDVKLIAAAALLVGSSNLFDFLFLMTLLGGVICILMLTDQWLGRWLGKPQGLVALGPVLDAKRQAAADAVTGGSPSIPYGVAIAGAAIWIVASSTLG